MFVELYGVSLGNIGFPPTFTHLINILYFMQGLVMGTGLMQHQDVASFSSKVSFFLTGNTTILCSRASGYNIILDIILSLFYFLETVKQTHPSVSFGGQMAEPELHPHIARL